jgi:hypothetical protein
MLVKHSDEGSTCDAATRPATRSTPASCGSFSDFIPASCTLTWSGITVYGVIDTGVSWWGTDRTKHIN